jgi:hypothetical protein
MQPVHIDRSMFDQALAQVKEKKGKQAKKAGEDPATAVAPFDLVRLESFHEGLSVQIMHIGPYSDEAGNLDKMAAHAAEHGYEYHGKHHEIYLGDPRTAKPENLKTVLRHPVRKTA